MISSKAITGLDDWASSLKAIAVVGGVAWATVTWALDDRYVSQAAIKDLASELRRDRIESQIRDVESQIALITLAAGYAETPEWMARRRGERDILDQKLESLERELEGVR